MSLTQTYAMEETRLPLDELNAQALDRFIYLPVSKTMIKYLARAAANVIACDPSLMPAPISKSHTPSSERALEPQKVSVEDGGLPSLEEFITQLVVSSSVQVPTLMSTLVYLNRLKSRLQPMARGLRCTTHRIFLAALILAAKYLNDSSPKNKHWANYSHINSDMVSFGFNRTEVNLMERQLLYLLDWELRITEQDLYRELDSFLVPIRDEIETKHARRVRRRRMAEQQQKLRELEVSATITTVPSLPAYPTPASSRSNSRDRTREASPASSASSHPVSPPGLTYSNSASPESSTTPNSSRNHSLLTTPLTEPLDGSYMCIDEESGYLTPVEMVVENGRTRKYGGGKMLLPYEISAEELRDLQTGTTSKKARTGKTMLGRVFSAVSVR